MKKLYSFILLTAFLLGFNSEVYSQPWTYNFGTGTGSFTNTTASTSFLPTPPSGTARVRTGTATPTAGTIVMANPGIFGLGSGTELQITSNTGSTSTTKFSVHDYTAGKTGYVKFKISFSGGTNGVYNFSLGDGANYSDNNAIGTAQIFAGLRWSFGASNVITYNVLNNATYGTTGIDNPTTLFTQDTSNIYEVEVYINNTTSTSTYFRSGTNYSLTNATWDLWVDGVRVGTGLAKGGIGADANIDSYAFNHQVSASAPGTIYIDDIEYSNSLPIANEPTTQASEINFTSVNTTSFTVNWTNGNGSSRAVFMKQGTGAITNPVDGTTYTASANWSSKGTELGSSGYYNIYNGTGNSVSVTNLSSSTEYTVQVFEYNGSGVTSNYYTATASNNPNSQTTNAPVDPTLTIDAEPLTEANLDGAVITLTLLNETFANETFDEANFTLNNAPSGVTVASVTQNSDVNATIILDYDGTDFDSDVNNFNITIAGEELTSGEPLTSNNLTITAIVETAPVVTTDAAITTNGTTTATWGGEVTSDGGEPVTQKGIVWNTSPTPTVALLTKTTEGAGTGDITGNMTGLSPNTLYYLRAYATNEIGTSYGAERSFTTNGLGAPTANDATSIATTSFTANWSSVTGATSYRLDVSTINTFVTEVTPEEDGFNNAFDAFSVTSGSGAFHTGNSASGDRPASSPFAIEGTHSYGVTNGTVTITTGNINVEDYENIELTFRLASFSIGSTGNGADAGDIVTVSISPDGGTNYFSTLRVLGNNNAWWAYSASGVASTVYDGNETPVDFQPAGGGERTTDGYSTVTITGLPNVSNLRIRINMLNNAAAERWVIDDFVLRAGQLNLLLGYSDLTVNSTSETVTGLTAGTEYFYRVRAFSPTSTSGNSSTKSVTTANNSQNTNVGGTGAQTVPVAGTTGVGEVDFTNVTSPGNLLISTFNNAPASPTGVVGNVATYRWIIGPDDNLVINEPAGYRLRFKVADLAGISELPHGNNNTIKLYKRTTPGSGAFSDLGFLTYDRNGTNGDQSDDILESALITTGFSEFVFGSESEPLPVELTSFTAKANGSNVNINWSTATEIMNFGFEIQRSAFSEQRSDNNWEKIAFVEGHGNSNSVKEYTYTDKNLSSGKYSYRLKQIDTDGTFSFSDVIEVEIEIPKEFALIQNYPNPFNPSTEIRYQLSEGRDVSLKVYDILGNEVLTLVNEYKEAGSYSVKFSVESNGDGSNISSGVYFYSIQAGDFTSVKKMLLMK